MPRNIITNQNFIERCKAIHGDKFDYSKTEFLSTKKPVIVTCYKHGDITINAGAHIRGGGCNKCRMENRRLTKEEYIQKAKSVHGDRYDYSQVEYTSLTAKISIRCPEHGLFQQLASNHLQGKGCPVCGQINRSESNSMPYDEFLQKAIQKHGNKYTYASETYTGASNRIDIVCPKHGKFNQIANLHLTGAGCPKCAIEKQAQDRTLSLEEFIERANKVHNGKYDYTKVQYVKSKEKVTIVCPIHGDFQQTSLQHFQGRGCPKCGIHISHAEDEIGEKIQEWLGEGTIQERTRELLSDGKEIDIYIPTHKLAIEYNGLIWHSEKYRPQNKRNYHLNKTLECQKLGIKLIHIFEDEWLEHKEIVLHKLQNILHLNNDLPVIGARKCIIKEIDVQTARDFLDKYHIQGYGPSTVRLGAYHNNHLLAVMTFKNNGKNNWELTRLASNWDYRLPGLASKLLSHFRKTYKYNTIKSFLDLRWNQVGNTVYEKLGFKVDCIEKPDYSYTIHNQRFHKFGFRKQILAKKYNLPLTMTEKEMTEKLGYFRIWNCGLAKYVLKKEEE